MREEEVQAELKWSKAKEEALEERDRQLGLREMELKEAQEEVQRLKEREEEVQGEARRTRARVEVLEEQRRELSSMAAERSSVADEMMERVREVEERRGEERRGEWYPPRPHGQMLPLLYMCQKKTQGLFFTKMA